MKKITRRKNIHARKSKQVGSPYWQFLDKLANKNGERGANGAIEFPEPPEANPDVLSEEEGIYSRQLSDEAVFRLDVIKEAMSQLSEQQQRILKLVGEQGRSFDEAATVLGVSKGTVQQQLNRARKKIEKLYVLRKAESSY